MSALGSSVINKSNKKFAPKKAPVRRSEALDTATPSTRPSEDRRTQSQTPQPPSLRRPIDSSTASPRPLAILRENQGRSHAPRVAPSNDANLNAVQIPVPSRSTPAPRDSIPPSIVPQKRSLNTIVKASAISVPTETSHPPTFPSSRSPVHATPREPPTATPSSVVHATRSHDHPEQTSPTQSVENWSSGTSARVTKRQKTNEQHAVSKRAKVAPVEADVPIPSTENNESDSRLPNAATRNMSTDKQSDSRRKKPAKRANRRPTPPSANNDSSQQHGEEAGQHTEEQAGSSSHPRKRKAKKPKVSERQQAIEGAAADIVQDAVRGASRTRKKGRRPSKRVSTPEGAENITIAPAETKMMELCRDSHTGKMSLREQELREMDRAAFVKQKQKELQEMMGQAESPNQTGSAEPQRERETRQERQRDREHEVALNVPNTVIRDGQIQIDEDSLHIDRHAAAAVERDLEELDPIDENDLSRRVTAGSFLKRDVGGGWNELLLDRFYQGLKMFGTDFDLISRMFPGKSRHAIKRKFVKEERLDYPRIKATLLGEKMPVVLEEYEKLTGAEYEDPAELEKVMEEDRKKLEEEQAAENEHLEEQERQRQEQAAAENAAASEDASGKDSQGRGRRKKKKKGKGKERQPRKRKKDDDGLGGDGLSGGNNEVAGQVAIPTAA